MDANIAIILGLLILSALLWVIQTVLKHWDEADRALDEEDRDDQER